MYALWRKVCALLCNIFNKYDSGFSYCILGLWTGFYPACPTRQALPFHLAQTADKSGFYCEKVGAGLWIRWEKQAHVLLTLNRTKFSNRTTGGKTLSFGSEIYWKLLKMSASIFACSLPIKPGSKSNAPENCCLNSPHSYLAFEASNNRNMDLYKFNFRNNSLSGFLKPLLHDSFQWSTTLCKSQLVAIM